MNEADENIIIDSIDDSIDDVTLSQPRHTIDAILGLSNLETAHQFHNASPTLLANQMFHEEKEEQDKLRKAEIFSSYEEKNREFFKSFNSDLMNSFSCRNEMLANSRSLLEKLSRSNPLNPANTNPLNSNPLNPLHGSREIFQTYNGGGSIVVSPLEISSMETIISANQESPYNKSPSAYNGDFNVFLMYLLYSFIHF